MNFSIKSSIYLGTYLKKYMKHTQKKEKDRKHLNIEKSHISEGKFNKMYQWRDELYSQIRGFYIVGNCSYQIHSIVLTSNVCGKTRERILEICIKKYRA